MSPKDKLKWIRNITLFGFLFAVAFYFIRNSLDPALKYPYNTFLYFPEMRYGDYSITYNATWSFHPYEGQFPSIYFPFSFILMLPFALFHGHVARWLYMATFLLFIFIDVKRWIPKSDNKWIWFIDILTLALLNYPVLFVLDRGNLDMYIYICLSIFVWSIRRGQIHRSLMALSAAISAKLFPITMLFLFLQKSGAFKWTKLFWISAYSVIGTIAALWIFNSLNEHSFFQLIAFHTGKINIWTSPEKIMAHSLSLKSMFLIIAYYFGLDLTLPHPNFDRVYQVFAIAALIPGLYTIFKVGRKSPFSWRTYILCSLFALMFQELSFSYRSIIMWPGILWFIAEEAKSKYDKIYCTLFGLLLIPKAYFVIFTEVTSTSFFGPAILGILYILLLIDLNGNQTQETRLKPLFSI